MLEAGGLSHAHLRNFGWPGWTYALIVNKSARLRSSYMTSATADALQAAIDDLHFSTRAPKYEVIAAIIRAGLADLGAIEAELRAQQASGA